MQLKGLYTALITPFTLEGKLDQEGLRQNLRYQLQHKVDGIVVLGTTGEAPTLNWAEKQTIIEIAREETKDQVLLMVGTGSYATALTITATQEAKEMGADAALIVTPYYNKPTQEGLYRHFATICQSVDLPICIYNVPSRTGQNLQTKTLQRLMQFDSIIGIKESSSDFLQMSEMIQSAAQHQSSFSVLSGDDALTLPLVALGGHGIISVASNLIPSLLSTLVKSALAGDFTEAQALHYQLLSFFKAAFVETNPIPIKAAMQLCGMAAGTCRLPLCDLAPASLQQLKQAIHSLPHSWLGTYGQTQSAHC